MDKEYELFAAWWNEPQQDELRKSCASGWGWEIWQASRQQRVTELPGWKLVPIEPTKEMVAAGQDKFEECIDHGFDSCEDGSTYEYSKISADAPYQVFKEMIAAAPEVQIEN